MAKLGAEARVAIAELARVGCPRTQIARLLGVARQAHLAAGWHQVIEYWRASLAHAEAVNLAALLDYLVEEHSYRPYSRHSPRRSFFLRRLRIYLTRVAPRSALEG